MRRGIYFAWGAWLIAGVVLGVLGVIPWGWATSALWFPLLSAFSILGGLLLVGDLGARAKRRVEAKIPDSCANCLFGSSCDLINQMRGDSEEKAICIGEKHGYTRGEPCEYYIRSKEAKLGSYNPLVRD